MGNKITVNYKTISAPVENVFPYFIEAGKLERWSAPQGMNLRVLLFEPHPGGKYRFEHSAKNGMYVCEGRIVEIVPEKSITMIDDFIRAPDGSQVQNIDFTFTFERRGADTEVRIVSSGFVDEKLAKECETAWSQGLDKLEKIIGRRSLQAASSLQS